MRMGCPPQFKPLCRFAARLHLSAHHGRCSRVQGSSIYHYPYIFLPCVQSVWNYTEHRNLPVPSQISQHLSCAIYSSAYPYPVLARCGGLAHTERQRAPVSHRCLAALQLALAASVRDGGFAVPVAAGPHGGTVSRALHGQRGARPAWRPRALCCCRSLSRPRTSSHCRPRPWCCCCRSLVRPRALSHCKPRASCG